MAVVINELEVTPAATPRPSTGGAAPPAGQPGPATVPAEMTRELEKALRTKHERMHRLIAW